MQLPQLKRIRWAVRATLLLGVAASVAANVLHARPNLISQTISAWPPLALLLTVELTSRIPMHRPLLAGLRVMATATIAGIAAWVSYWHMQGVAVHYGETEMSSFLLPISVDGLIVVASVSLVELAGRIRVVEERRLAQASAAMVPAVQFLQPAPAQTPIAAPVFHAAGPVPTEGSPAAPGWNEHPAPAAATLSDTDDYELDRALSDDAISRAPVSPAPQVRPYAAPVTRSGPPARTARYANGSRPTTRPAVSPTRSVVTSSTIKPVEAAPPKQRREPKEDTVRLADEIEAMDPKASEKEIAERLGITVATLRRARREVSSAR